MAGVPDPVSLQILGPLRIGSGDAEVHAGPRQQRCLLGLLLARAGSPIGMERLVDLLWGHDPPPTAVNVIHKYVGALRRLLEPGLPPRAPGAYLARHGNGYRFTGGPQTLDLLLFRQLVAEAKAYAGRDELDEALDRYTEALRLVHGPAGDGLAGTPAARATFASLDGEFLDTVVTAAGLAVRLRRPARLLAPLRRAAELDPLNEYVHACLVTTLAAAGHQAEALTAYRLIRSRLTDELDLDPGPDLREAHRRVLTRTVLPPSRTDPPDPLARLAQLPPDQPFFTGRRDELATLGKLRAAGRTGPLVIALHGPPGVGTSTLAVRFAHLVAGDFTDGQLYLDLRGDRAGDTLPALLEGLGVRAAEVPGTFGARVGTYRSLTAGRRILVLLDNVRDAEQVRPLLPSSAGSLVLLTGSSPLIDLAARDGAHLIRVGVPNRPEARELLERRLAGLPHRDTALIDEIVELSGRLPLTLALTAARLTADPGAILTGPRSPERMRLLVSWTANPAEGEASDDRAAHPYRR